MDNPKEKLKHKLKREENNCSLHGEFFAIGWGKFLNSYELPLVQHPGARDTTGVIPRKNGYQAMTSLLKKLEDFSGQPLVQK